MSKKVDIELTQAAFEMPKITPIVKPDQTTKRRSYFAKMQEKDEDSLMEEISAMKEMLDQSTIRIPEVEGCNTNSYDKVRRIIFGQAIKYNVTKIEQKFVTFSDVVDIDDEGIEIHIKEGLAARFGEGNFFRIFIFVLIIMNSIVIGLETDTFLETHGVIFFALIDYIFLAFFIAEIFLKCYYGFIDFWMNQWNWFDVFIILAALAGPSVSFLTNSRTLRILRVLRTLRSLRSIAIFQGLDMVIRTIFESLPDMFYIGMLIVMAMFIWGGVGVVLFSEVSPLYFGNLGLAMFSLFVVISEDGWVEIHEINAHNGQYLNSALYFVSFLTIGAFILQQLIVALVVANLEETQASAHRNVKDAKKTLMSDVRSTRGQKRFQRSIVPQPSIEEAIWKDQIPYEIPNFDNFSVAKIERYFLILSIVEKNLGEYVDLKVKIEEILSEVQEVNKDEFSDEEEDEFEWGDDGGEREEEGDAMATWMKMNESTRNTMPSKTSLN